MDAVATENRPKPKRKQYMTKRRREALEEKVKTAKAALAKAEPGDVVAVPTEMIKEMVNTVVVDPVADAKTEAEADADWKAQTTAGKVLTVAAEEAVTDAAGNVFVPPDPGDYVVGVDVGAVVVAVPDPPPTIPDVAAAPSPPVVNPNNPKNWMITFYPEGSTRGKGQWVCRQETADVVWVWDNEGRHTALFKRMTPDHKEMPFRELAMEYVDMKNSQKLVMA